MAGRTVPVTHEGKQYDGIPVDVSSTNENFNQYLLEDGTVLRTRAILVSVTRVPDVYDNQDNPLYIVRQQNLVIAESPESLRKPKP